MPITVATSVPGLQITVDGTPYTSPQTFNWTPGSNHTLSTSSPQSGGVGTTHNFSHWSGGGQQTHTITAPASPVTYTAYFTTQYLLTTSVGPTLSGTVSPDCTAGCWQNSGSIPTLTANPGGGYAFSSWTGSISSASNPVQVMMDSPKTVIANFNPATTITTSPAGRQVTIDGNQHTTPQTFYWSLSTNHTIYAPSPQTSGETRCLFSSWSDGGAQAHTVNVGSSPATYTATYLTQHLLNVSVSPPGSAKVSSSHPSPDSYVDSGSLVTLVALPGVTYIFTSWTGDCVSTLPSVMVSMTAPRTCTANLTTCIKWPVRVLGGAPHGSLQVAYDDVATTDGSVIQALAVNVAESVDFAKDIGVELQGGFDCNYTGNSSATLLTGSLTVSKGTVTIEGIIIR